MIITRVGTTQNPIDPVDEEQPPTPEAPPTPSTTLEWEAPWMGRKWTLTDLASPVIKLEGMKGVSGPEPVHWFTEAPTLDGAAWNGMRMPRGELFLPALVQADGIDAFLSEHAAFRRSLNPHEEGLFRVIRPDGTYREIACRFDSGGELTADYDPFARQMATFGVTWSTDPYWQGAPVERVYEYQVGTPLFPGPPFTISKGFAIENARITNPGDVPGVSFPTWRVTAPFTAFQVGVGTALVKATLTKTTGWIDIDMNPTRLTVTDQAGTDQWSALTDVEFTAIPPGDDVPLALSVTGAAPGTAVRLSFIPRYWSAW